MSFVPDFAPDARSQWQALDILLQEMVLDEIERLAASPPLRVEHVSDLTHDVGPSRHYLFVHVNVDHRRRAISVVGVGYSRGVTMKPTA
jgi:hypothetical protein